MTQMCLAEILGLSQAQISRIESGRSPARDLEKLTEWSIRLAIPQFVLWFSLPDSSSKDAPVVDDPPPATLGVGRIPLPDDHATDYSRSLKPTFSTAFTGTEDAEVVRQATHAFRQIDNQFGGGRARAAVSAYLESEVANRLLDSRFARGSRSKFEQAAAEMYQLAGWMSYDVGDEKEGKRNLRRALEISVNIKDEALTAEMLSAMSHHAAFSRRAEETIDLAIAARRAALRSGVPALRAESAVLEAQGLALQHDSRGSLIALRRAEQAFAAASTGNTPAWLSYFDRAYLSAKFAQTLRDLGLTNDAERFARESLQMSEGFDRGRLFNTALLASILADGGAIEEAVTMTRSAVAMSGRVRSSRARRYLGDVTTSLLPHKAAPCVEEVLLEMRSSNAARY